MDSREIRELLSACRPDRSDLTAEQRRAIDAKLDQDAALRKQWESSQAWDARLEAAFKDVPVPAGLADQLLAAVSEALAPPATTAEDAGPETTVFAAAGSPAAVESVELRPRHTVWTRRTLLVAAACAAAVLVVAGPLMYWHWNDPLTTEFVINTTDSWEKRIDPAAWRDDAGPSADYALDSTLALYNVSWQPLAVPYDSNAVVYRATLAPNHTSALLFVVRTDRGQTLDTIPPTRPNSSTGGRCIGVWKSQGNLYVLVVHGSSLDYLQAIRQAYA